MNITVIGAGNMGGAIAGGLAEFTKHDITVSDPDLNKTNALKDKFPSVRIADNNCEAVKHADLIVLAVKPYLVSDVIDEIKSDVDCSRQIIVSIAAGITLSQLDGMFTVATGFSPELYRVIPDTAIMVRAGMSFISSHNASEKGEEKVRSLFDVLGETAVIPENLMAAATSLSSCGIAYAFKYIQACVQAGVEMGFRPDDSLKYSVATVAGAMRMLAESGNQPQTEIDRVTTPGGLTIKGVNSLDHSGFPSAVIKAILSTFPVSRQ